MRDLKFRIWNSKGNYTKFSLNERSKEMAPLFTEFVDDEFLIQQFTGYYDKNNVEIYEGDWLRYYLVDDYVYENWLEQVNFNNGCFYVGEFVPLSTCYSAHLTVENK